MTTFTEGRHNGEFIMSELPGNLSRDNVTIVSGAGVLVAGTVLGKITASGKYTTSLLASSDGSEDPVAILINDVDATSADVSAAIIANDAEVNKYLLTFGADINTDNEKATARAALTTAARIKCR
jgi:hypothetical protein